MEFGLMTEPQLGMAYDTLSGLAQWAETAGLAAFARADHYSFPNTPSAHATDAFASLAGLARDTERIDLVVLVSPITFRHPGVIVKMAATIHEMSGERFRLGLGTGWMQEEHTDFGFDFFDQNERFDRLEEALQYVHHALGKADGPFRGEYYTLEKTTVLPHAPSLPIILGGFGPRRSPRLAGTYADEFNFSIKDHGEMRLRIDRARQAAENAGRDPDRLLISVMTPAIVGRDEAEFRENLARIAAADPFGRDAATLDEKYRERGYPVGSADEALTTIAALEDLGVQRIYVQHFGPYGLDLLASVFAGVAMSD